LAKGPELALKIASAAASISVSRKGAAHSIPWQKEVEEKLVSQTS